LPFLFGCNEKVILCWIVFENDTISNADTLDDEIGVNQSQFTNVNIDGEKSDESYDFMIGDDDVESESDDDVTQVKQNVMKDNGKRERLAQLLESCKCSGGVITSTK